jgi:hypothetical protein
VFPTLCILALGFTNLAMLGWLAAAAAPLLIHLWSRHRFREAPWAAMQFLLAAMRKNARRMQLQQWLLLAVRTLIIALVVLAVAEPYSKALAPGGGSAPVHKVIVVDASLSMAYRDDGASRFDRAKKLAVDLVRESRAGDSFTIILMATPAEIIVRDQNIDVSAAASQIRSLAQTHEPADLPHAIALVKEVLAEKSNDQTRSRREEVYFFTDLQRATWQSPPDAVKTLAERAALFVVDVGQPNPTNLAVTHLTTSEPFVTVDREVAWEAALRQFGAKPLADCRVELVVDDIAVSEQSVDVPAGGEANVRFLHRFATPGAHTLAIRAANDGLEADNARWIAVPVRDEIRVLCVEGREGAAKYIVSALNPNPSAQAELRAIVATEGELAEIQLADFDCVFLCNVPQLTASEAQRLTRYAAAGGSIIFFLGDRVSAESYNRLSVDSDEERGKKSLSLMPARIGELVTEPSFGLDPLDYRHAIVAPFRGNERAGLLTTPVSCYFRLELPKNLPHVEVVATIGRGDPFIVTAPLGKGRTLLVATDGSLASVDPKTGEPWTIWPTWPSFLPIVRELLAYGLSLNHEEWQYTVGAALSSRAISDPAANTEILRPDGATAPVALHKANGERQWSYSDTELAGVYTLVGPANDASQRFAFNVDSRESDLTRIDTQQLPQEFVVRSSPKDLADEAPITRIAQADWSGRLLWFALALLLAESYFAWRFSRGVA